MLINSVLYDKKQRDELTNGHGEHDDNANKMGDPGFHLKGRSIRKSENH
jgi:hypothetical protein